MYVSVPVLCVSMLVHIYYYLYGSYVYICAVDIHTATAQQEKNMKKDIMAANLSDNKEIREARHQQWLTGRRAETLLCQV